MNLFWTPCGYAGGRNDEKRAPWMMPYRAITVTAFFTNEEELPFPEGIARNHTQTGQAEEILVIICTWAVVKVRRARRSCETARLCKMLTLSGEVP